MLYSPRAGKCIVRCIAPARCTARASAQRKCSRKIGELVSRLLATRLGACNTPETMRPSLPFDFFVVVVVLALGKWLRAYACMRSGGCSAGLLKLLPKRRLQNTNLLHPLWCRAGANASTRQLQVGELNEHNARRAPA